MYSIRSLTDEVELINASPSYENIRLPDGKTTTVSTRDLPPRGSFLEGERHEEAPVISRSADTLKLIEPSESWTTAAQHSEEASTSGSENINSTAV